MNLATSSTSSISRRNSFQLLVYVASVLLISCSSLYSGVRAAANNDLQVIYAINAGGYDHTDKYGILYEADPLNVGTASDYGNHLLIIGRVPQQDEVLYRTERYHTSTFGYDLPLEGDGNYALLLKFCEVYFNEPNKKVFDVVLNRQHEIVSNLDIFAQVGRGTAHDEYIFFTVSRGKLHYKDEVSDIRNNVIRLEFIKGAYDNPKINAFALFKGDVERIPRLPAMQSEGFNTDDQFEEKKHDINGHSSNRKLKTNTKKVMEDDVEEDLMDADEEVDDEDNIIDDDEDVDSQYDNEAGHDDLDDLERERRNKKTSGPRHPDPYASEDSTIMMPVIVAIGCFIPLLFCLCKL
ncbi:malectin-like [Musca domestica]|uniref:Malectin-like n=1 Tax=Musca domestica TaxID=7370 RepID=A0ABM3UTC0_MUSDO|nr:malectin-like [Musca domestica]